MAFAHGANSKITFTATAGDPIDLTPYIKGFEPGAFKAAIPGLRDHTMTFTGSWVSYEASTWDAPPDDPLDEVLAAAGITDQTPSHWQRIHRARTFDAEQKATRERLAAEWEPGQSERRYT